MPFTKLGKNRYRSPSGRIFTLAMVQAYYASLDDKRKKKKKKSKKRSKK